MELISLFLLILFLDQNGNVVSGNIDVELIDAQDNKDMLQNSSLTQ